eukprot:763877-Hanusia_phi.AAC.4
MVIPSPLQPLLQFSTLTMYEHKKSPFSPGGRDVGSSSRGGYATGTDCGGTQEGAQSAGRGADASKDSK